MSKTILLIKSLVPIPIYFLITWFVKEYLTKFTVVGPVAKDGQPLIENYPAFLSNAFIAAIILGSIYSFYYARKINGWQKYASMFAVLAFMPIQYAYVVILQISLFGK
jgi:hypothetical protein